MDANILLILAVVGAFLSVICWFCSSTAHKRLPKPQEGVSGARFQGSGLRVPDRGSNV